MILNSGVLTNPNNISDHSATYTFLPHDYSLSSSYMRTVWLYKRANYEDLRSKIAGFDWECLKYGTIDEACTRFTENFLNLVESCIPKKQVIIRPTDKPWYDSVIRKFSRARNRQKSIAVRTGKENDWKKYKTLRNKVNNLKKHAKECFYDNLETSLLESHGNNKKEYWKIIRHFVKNKITSSSIPPLCTTLESGESIISTTDYDKANCFILLRFPP